MNVITERIDVFAGDGKTRRLACSFWWASNLIACHHTDSADRACSEGITGPGGARVFPRDGRVFFESLARHFTAAGYVVDGGHDSQAKLIELTRAIW